MSRPVVFAAFSVLLAFAKPASAVEECLITFGVGTSTPLTAFSVTVDYQDAPGEFEGSGSLTNCDPLSNYSVATNDQDVERKMSLGLLTINNPVNGPKDLLHCKWLPTSRSPLVEDFNLTDQSGLDANFDDVDPQVSITSIVCESVTTTTTLPEVLCGDWDGSDVIQVSDALGVLRTSVGTVECPLCVCDLDGNGGVFVGDALMALRLAVGVELSTNCPGC